MRILGIGVVLIATALLLTQQTYSNSHEQCRYIYTDNEIQDLLDGEGISVSHDGELNQYPGPRQVLAAAKELGLDPDQVRNVTAVYGQMKHDTIELGRAIVEQERQLDDLISTGGPTAAADLLVREVADKHAQMKHIHVAAHAHTKSLLTPEQLERYHQLHAHTPGHSH